MSSFRGVSCLVPGLLLITAFAHAATGSTATVTLSANADGTMAISPKEAITLTAGADQPIDIHCDSAGKVDCTQYSLEYAQKRGDSSGVMITAGAITSREAQWVLPWAAVVKCQSGDVLVFSKAAGKALVARIPVSVPTDASCAAAAAHQPPEATSPEKTQPKPVSQLVGTDCSEEINTVLSSLHQTNLYDTSTNRALFVVTPSGNVLARPDVAVDEGDTVDVIVIGDKNLLPKLAVRRSSAIRTLGTLNIVGADVQVPAYMLKAKENPCGFARYSLADFAPGKGEVTISVAAEQGNTTTGTFDFDVATLYSGAFSIGPLYTTLKEPTFGLVSTPSGNRVTETDLGSDRVIYALIFTPFVWGKRDLEKERLRPMLDWHRLNPMFGIVLNDVSNNAIVGVSYDLSSLVYLNLGVQFGKVKRLDPTSGLTLGGAFTGGGTTVPTQTHWKAGFFIGFSMDLRAATKFFGLGSPKS